MVISLRLMAQPGEMMLGEIPMIDPELSDEFQILLYLGR